MNIKQNQCKSSFFIRGTLQTLIIALSISGYLFAAPSGPKDSTAILFLPGNYANQATDGILENPLIKGVLVAERWADIEPEEGNYNWSQLDEKIIEIASSGKRVILNIMTSGVNVPQWVIERGAKTFTFKATNPNQPIYGQTFTVPLYWDETYLSYKKKFIKELGKRYANNPAVAGVMVSFLGTINNDWYIPKDRYEKGDGLAYQELLDKGYTTNKMFNAGKETIDAWTSAFPKQALKLPIGKSIPDNGNSITALAEKILNYAYSTYPYKFYAQINALCSKIPEADDARIQNANADDPLYLLKLLSQHPYHIGFQMLCDAAKHSERLDKGHVNVSPKHILEWCINVALTYHPYYIEYWHADCENPDFQDILMYANYALLFQFKGKRFR